MSKPMGRLALACALLLAAVLPGWSHGPAKWIQDGQYRNAVGQLCCGEQDCVELSSADVTVTPAGYLIRSLNETVPFSQATPSPTGTYWRCAWGGERKCFFAPPGAV